jgi:hypothetical protein
MIDKCSCGATCSQVEALEARIKVLQDALGVFDIEAGDYVGRGIIYTPEIKTAIWDDK